MQRLKPVVGLINKLNAPNEFARKLYSSVSSKITPKGKSNRDVSGRYNLYNGICTSSRCCKAKEEMEKEQSLVLYSFANAEKKEKKTFLKVLEMYTKYDVHRRGQVEFIKHAMKYMEMFGVNKDLEAYKRLMCIFPAGKYVPENFLQVGFFHYPKHQECAVHILERMEDNRVIPDREMRDLIYHRFGNYSEPMKKCRKLLYWVPKFKNLNPWVPPMPMPSDTLEVAKFAIWKVSSVDDCSKVTVYKAANVKESIDKTWIVSSMSRIQGDLLKRHPLSEPLFVDGPTKIWMSNKNVDYFILKSEFIKRKLPDYDPDDVSDLKVPFWDEDMHEILPIPSVHEQSDGSILAMCATGTSSKDSLLSWIRCLQQEYPVLGQIPIVFRLASVPNDTEYIESEDNKNISESSDETKEINQS